MVRETAPFPEWNPQAEFISAEENSRFQSIFADGTCLFLQLYQLVEILISTKGVDFVDTFRRSQKDFSFLSSYKPCRNGNQKNMHWIIEIKHIFCIFAPFAVIRQNKRQSQYHCELTYIIKPISYGQRQVEK